MTAASGNPKRRRIFRIWAALIAVGGLLELTFVLSVRAGKKGATPGSTRPAAWYAEKYALFIPAGTRVHGLYQHQAGSADIFEYRLDPEQHPSWSANLAAAAEGEGWRVTEQSEHSLRCTNQWKSGWMQWHAEVRLVHDPARRVVTVGYCPSAAEYLPDKTFVPTFWKTFDAFAAGKQ